MGIGRTNASAGGAGASLRVIAPIGVTVTVAKGEKTYTRTANEQGIAIFKGLLTGTWTVTISDGVSKPASRDMLITADYTIIMAFFSAYIPTNYPAGSTCTCSKGSQVLTAPDTSGNYTFTVPEVGDWVISCTDGTQTASKTISITADGQSVSVSLNYNTIPEFTYTGEYEIVDDNDNPITTSQGNWKIRFLTSGTLIFTDLRGAEDGIDVFLVGGGGGGASNEGSGNSGGGSGGGGYTTTARGLLIEADIAYEIAVGAGGVSGSDGGNSSAFAQQANGGHRGGHSNGGSGGSGGGAGPYGKGGVDGADGTDGGKGSAGKGQGATTREFGEKTGTLYSNGGTYSEGAPSPMGDNTGNGGRGRPWNTNGPGGTGGSGIIIIRNRREEAA